MYRIMICENNLQLDLCCLDYGAVGQWSGLALTVVMALVVLNISI